MLNVPDRDMTPADALEAAIKAAGSQTALSEICGCTQGAISQMVNRPEPRLSHPYVLKVEAATGVCRHDLRPDLYPPEDAAERAAAA